MGKESRGRGNIGQGVNPQGDGQFYEANKKPKSKLEDRSKKKNTKI